MFKPREIHKFTQEDGHMMVCWCLPPDKLYISRKLASSITLRVCVSVGFNSAQSFRHFSFRLFFSPLLSATLSSWSKVTFLLQLQWTTEMTGRKHNNGGWSEIVAAILDVEQPQLCFWTADKANIGPVLWHHLSCLQLHLLIILKPSRYHFLFDFLIRQVFIKVQCTRLVSNQDVSVWTRPSFLKVSNKHSCPFLYLHTDIS